MDNKQLLKNPAAAISEYWPNDDCPYTVEIASLIKDLESSNKKIKALLNEKKLCSKQFKTADDHRIGELKQEMKAISLKADQLSTQRKVIEQQLLSLFIQPDTAIEEFPLRFSSSNDSAATTISTTICHAVDADEKDWDRYVSQHPRASLYHLYYWRRIITSSFNQKSHYLIARDLNNEVRGLLPICNLASNLFGNYGVSLPFFNYGGPLADNQEVSEQLINAASQLAKQKDWKHLEIRTTDKSFIWPCRRDKCSMILALPANDQELDKQLGSKLRAQINRSTRENLEITGGRHELLSDFYEVFSINMRDLGTPVYSKQFFSNILSATGNDNSHIIVIRRENKPVAAAFLLGYGDTLEIPWASTLRETNKLGINMRLYRQVLSHALSSGYKFFDFGRSSQDAGTFQFKKQWGAKPVQHYWYYPYLKSGDLPQLNPDNPKYQLVISIWRRLPVVLTNIIGPHIVKNLP